MEDILVELIETISNLAPEVWAIYLNQVTIEGVNFLIWGIFLFVLTFALIKGTFIAIEKYGDDYCSSWDVASFFIGLTSLGAFIFGFLCLSGGIMRLLNPEFYVIKYLLAVATGQ